MSKSSKKISMKNKSVKNYKIESLEPRFLMDASSGYSADDWNSELNCIAAPTFWNADELKKKTSANENYIIDGLFVVNQNTATTDRAMMSDLLSYDSKDKDGKSTNDFGLYSLEEVFNVVKDDVNKVLDGFEDGENITAEQLCSKIMEQASKKYNNTVKRTYSSYGYKTDIFYNASLMSDGRLVLGISTENDISKEKNVTLSADVSDTSIAIETKFDFSEYKQELKFSFILDGLASNKVDMTSTSTFTIHFEEDSDSDYPAKYGVLALKKGSGYLDIASEWTASSKWDKSAGKLVTTSDSKNGIGAELTYQIQSIGDTFVENKLEDKKYKFKYLLYGQNYREVAGGFCKIGSHPEWRLL